MTKSEILELIREMERYAIQWRVEDYHVILSGGYRKARHHYEELIAGDSDAEAMLILEYSKKDEDLRYDIEERASIIWAEGSPYNLLEAVKIHMEVARENEADGQLQARGEMPL